MTYELLWTIENLSTKLMRNLKSHRKVLDLFMAWYGICNFALWRQH